MSKGQGTIEYLIILSVVLVASVLTVTTSGYWAESNTNLTIEQSILYWQTATPIGIKDWQLETDGKLKIQLKNNSGEKIIINEIYFGGKPINIPLTTIFLGNTKVISGQTDDFAQNSLYSQNIKIDYDGQYITGKIFTGKKPLVGIVIQSSNDAVQLAEFVDNTLEEFDEGAYSNTSFNSIIAGVELASGTTGTFESRIFDAQESKSWKSISWVPEAPYGKELNGTESKYTLGNANLSNNTLLMHLNDFADPVLDSSGNGNNGTNSGATFGATGKFNTAMNFDGSTDIIIGSSSNAITGDNLQTITFSAWVKHNYSGDNGYIASLKRSNGNLSSLISLDAGNSGAGNLGFLTRNNADTTHSWINYNGNYNDGKWHQLVAVVDGLSRKLYVDGIERNSDSRGMQSVTNNTDSFNIGGFHQSYSNLFFKGSIDEVAVWKRALSTQEILDQYQRGALNIVFEVRSCDDSNCSGETFSGNYSEINNFGTGLPSFSLSVPDNRYFQYKATMTTQNTSYSPKLREVIIEYE